MNDRYEVLEGEASAVAVIGERLGELCASCGRAIARSEIYSMYISMASKDRSVVDYEKMSSLYAEELSIYPEDVVVHVCRHMRRTATFFPTLSELVAACEARVEFRRGLLRQFEKMKTGGDMSGRANYSAMPDEAMKSYKDMPKRFWKEHQWSEFVRDAASMLETARKHPAHFSVEEWAATLANRHKEAALAGFAQSA